MGLTAANRHLLINSALRAARRLAEEYDPVTPAQKKAQARLMAAIADGDLRRAQEAMYRAMDGRLATREWAQTAREWRMLVEQKIEGAA